MVWPFKATASPVVLFADDAYLRIPQSSDYEQWHQLRSQSRKFLEPWEPEWTADDLAKNTFEQRVLRNHQDYKNDTGYAFFLFRAVDDALIGGVGLTAVQRGAIQKATLGYWMGKNFTNQGWMSKGSSRLLAYAFETLALHRVEAACLPHNEASMRLLEKNGFEREGYARQYLCIQGEWQDHVLFARLRPDAHA